jgi:hypothetical protein
MPNAETGDDDGYVWCKNMCCGAGHGREREKDDERLRCCSKACRGHPKVIKSRSEATSFIKENQK